MKVTFVALNYAPSVGGAQEHVRHLAEGLAARGHDVEVLTTDAERSVGSQDPGRLGPPVEELGGVVVRRHRVAGGLRRAQRRLRSAVRRLPGADPQGPNHPTLVGPMAPGLWWAVRRALRDRDVVVGCSAPFLTLVLPPLLRARRGARVVSMPLLHVSRSRPGRSVGWALRRSDATLASTSFERDVQVGVGVAADRVSVVPPGTDPDRYPELAAAGARALLGLPERPTVGYVGRLAAYKGVDTLLEAAPALWDGHPDLTVLVAGAFSGWTGHRDHPAGALGGERLVVREDFGADERAALLAACDVVAFPSREESFGLGIVEAWAARRPVVAAGIPAVRDVVTPGVDGELVDPGDAAGLAGAIGRLLDDPARAARLGRAGRARVEADLSWSSIVAEWDRVLGDVVARPSRPRRDGVA